MKSAETAIQCVSTFSSGLSSVAINLPAGVGEQDAEVKKNQTGAKAIIHPFIIFMNVFFARP